MPGIRLRHATLRSCVYVIELDQNFANPNRVYDCPTCRRQHARKAMHLRLDDGGTAMVSETTPAPLLATLRLAGLTPENAVGKPPTTYIGAVAQPKLEVVTKNLNDVNLRSHYVEARNQYESRDTAIRPFQPVLDAAAERIDRQETARRAEKRTIFKLGGK